ELDSQLDEARRRRADDLAERGAADISVDGARAGELSVVERVEGFQAKLQRLRFREFQVLQQRQVVIIAAGTEKEAAPGVSRSAEQVGAEERSIEIRISVARVRIQMERPGGELGLVHAVVIDAVWLRAQQGVVSVIDQRHRKAAAESRDARNLPALRPSVRGVEKAFNGKLVVVTYDEVVLHVERRESSAKSGIDGIDLFPHVRRLVYGLAERVGGEELQTPAGVAQAHFERVVIRIANRGLVRVAAEIRPQRSARPVDRPARRWADSGKAPGRPDSPRRVREGDAPACPHSWR